MQRCSEAVRVHYVALGKPRNLSPVSYPQMSQLSVPVTASTTSCHDTRRDAGAGLPWAAVALLGSLWVLADMGAKDTLPLKAGPCSL